MCFLVEVAFWGVIVLLVWTFLSKVSRTRGGGHGASRVDKR